MNCSLPSIVTGLLLACGLCAVEASTQAADKPNIIFVFTDDQGYGDLSCLGNPILKTKHLDKLHSQSARFTQFHVSPTCAPSRSTLMTGMHEFYSGVTHTINERERMALTSTTFPELIKKHAGYTNGIFGKWHLGDEDDYQPNRRGFDEVFIHGAGGIGQSYPGSCGDAPNNSYFSPTIWHNDKFVRTDGYCTDVFFDQAMKWMDGIDKDQPFFCYISTNAPHTPLDCPEDYIDIYKGKVNEKQARFFGMCHNIDDNMGKLMDWLDKSGRADNTVLMFMTDNGGTFGVPIFNDGMRGRKGQPYLGGIRVPFFVRWPGVTKPVDIDVLTGHIDFFPTILEIAGVEAVPDKTVGGRRSLVPLLKNPQTPWEDRVLFTHVGRWDRGKAADSKYRMCSLRNTRFQMVSLKPNGEKAWELYDLKNDFGQTTNVIDKFPEEAKKLEEAYDKWWSSLPPFLVNEDAVGPEVNPFKERYWKQFPDERPKE